jgi:hypothetical protein
MKLVSLLALLTCTLLHAAPPDEELVPAETGLLELRRMEPFHAKVTECTVEPGSFMLALKGKKRSVKYFETRPSKALRQVLMQLKTNHEYEFPKVLNDVLGAPPANIGQSLPYGLMISSRGLFDADNTRPVRATLVGKTVTADAVTLEFETISNGHQTLTGKGPQRVAELMLLAKLLQEGHTYEFPDVMRKPVPATFERPAVVKPASPAMEALKGFIGTWEMPVANKPGQRIELRCFWKNDGTGIWREAIVPPSADARLPSVHAELLTYDPAKHCYFITSSGLKESPSPVEASWDAESRTLTSRLPASQLGAGAVLTVIRTLTTPDRIDWTIRSSDKTGKVLKETSGVYTRHAD